MCHGFPKRNLSVHRAGGSRSEHADKEPAIMCELSRQQTSGMPRNFEIMMSFNCRFPEKIWIHAAHISALIVVQLVEGFATSLKHPLNLNTLNIQCELIKTEPVEVSEVFTVTECAG